RILIPPEIDDAVPALVAAAPVARRDPPSVVATTALGALVEKRSVRFALVKIRIPHLDDEAPPGRRRFCLGQCHRIGLYLFQYQSLPLSADKIDFLTLGQRDVSLLPIRTATTDAAKALRLALDVHHANALDLDVEQLLNRCLDLVLGRISRDLEHHLIGGVGDHRTLLGHVRPEHNLKDALLIHPSHSSTRRTASTVIRTFSCRSSETGSRPIGSRTSTLGRLREARYRLSLTSLQTMSTSSKPSAVSLPTSSFVLGFSTSKDSTTTRRSCRASSERIERIAPRYLFLFTFCSKLRGFAANATPPERHSGLRIDPARARPVPF